MIPVDDASKVESSLDVAMKEEIFFIIIQMQEWEKIHELSYILF